MLPRGHLLILAAALITASDATLPTNPRPARLTPPALHRAALPHASTILMQPTPTSADCKESYFDQTLDHFDYTNGTDTYPQRYFVNDTFFKKGGPVLFYTGNEVG